MINFSKSHWNDIQSVLDNALDQPKKQREGFIKSACGDDIHLFKEVKALLNAENNTPIFLEQPIAGFAEDLFAQMGDHRNKSQLSKACEINSPDTPTAVGPYKLCEELGRGGMGVVYRAIRHQGEFEQEVAVKLLSGFEGNELQQSLRLSRFQQEQQALASLNHPHIAQLYDGGLSQQQAFIVMEYVKGKPINRYCDHNKLNIDTRLKLIIQVAEALDFAHKNLIVHRDIKPSNILINDTGQVKLLDFSIAKLLSPQNNPALTQTGELLMTPGFAAPEQIKNLNITVATDIYQLGLVMYELLTGKQAFSDQADSMYHLARVICERTPTRPSIIAEPKQHNTDSSHKWQKELRGDLDAILLKTLRNEPEQRYASMQALLADINAYFNNHVIKARKQNLRYQLYKFTLKHWRSLLVTMTFIIFLIIYAVTITIQSQTIKKALQQSKIETTKVQQIADFIST